MKKLFKLLLFILIFGLNVWYVQAEPVDNDNSSEVINENEEKEPEKEETKSSDNTLKDIYINEEKIVCSNFLCEKIIEDNSITKVKITYKVNDSKATVSKDMIEETLKEGDNTFTVDVTAEDETKQTYTFKITKKILSTDSSLSKLSLNGEEITLKDDVLKYNITVSYAIQKLEIEAIPTSDLATVESAKDNKITYNFYEDTKEIKVKVKAEAGEITTYVINVTRREEKDATLKSLTISNVPLNFESGVFDYEVLVFKNVSQLDINAVSNDSKAEIDIQKPEELVIGENTVTIKVSNDGNEKTYTIKITKNDEEDTTIANLESLKIEGYDLEFKPDKYEYDLKINDDNSLVINAIPKQENADVEITGNLDLVSGSVIKIRVSYDNEFEKIYKINIIKDDIIQEKDNNFKIIIIIVIICIIIAIIILIIIQVKNKRKNNSKKKKENNIIEEQPINKENMISITDELEEIDDII